MSGGHLCEAEAPTEAVAETSMPSRFLPIFVLFTIDFIALIIYNIINIINL